MRYHLCLVCCTHQETLLVQDCSTGRVVIHLLWYTRVQSIDEDISEFVPTCNSLIIDACDTSDPPRLGIVGKNEELSGGNGAIDTVESWFLHVTDDYSGSLDVDGNDSRGESLPDISYCPLE